MHVMEVTLNRWITLYQGHLAFALAPETNMVPYHGVIRRLVEQVALNCYRSTGQRSRLLVLDVDGAYWPYMETPDYFRQGMVLTHPFDTRLFDLNQRYSTALAPWLAPLDVTVGADVNFYIVEPDSAPDFKSWLRDQMKIKLQPHFFGSKHDEIAWDDDTWPSLDERDQDALVALSLRHRIDFVVQNEVQQFDMIEEWDGDWQFPGAHLVFARKSLDIVGAMLCLPGATTGNADIIARDPDPALRPWSLVLAAQAAAVREVVFGQGKRLNLGLNLRDMPYKHAIKHTRVPLLNLPLHPIGASLAGIKAGLDRKVAA